MNPTIRRTLLTAVLGLAAIGPAAAQGSAFPTKPLRLVVPYPPGGIGDTMARELAQALAPRQAFARSVIRLRWCLPACLRLKVFLK